MKKHTLSFEIVIFFVIFILFIASSFVSGLSSEKNITLFSTWTFPLNQLLLSAFCVSVLVIFYEKKEKKILIVFPVVMTTGLLFCVSLFCKAFSSFINFQEPLINVSKPESFVQWIFCLLTFLSAAFNEEVIFRFYFSDKLFQHLSEKIRWKILRFLCEAAGLLCFAFAHLYLGWISVLNAAAAHVILRMCYLKNEKLWPCVASHFIYNVISLILL